MTFVGSVEVTANLVLAAMGVISLFYSGALPAYLCL